MWVTGRRGIRKSNLTPGSTAAMLDEWGKMASSDVSVDVTLLARSKPTHKSLEQKQRPQAEAAPVCRHLPRSEEVLDLHCHPASPQLVVGEAAGTSGSSKALKKKTSSPLIK